jgi:membrane AbrB-like protein
VSNVLTSLIAAMAGAALFHVLNVPAGAMLGATTGVIAHNLLLSQVPSLHPGIEFLAFVALGWLVGQGVSRDNLGVLRHSVLPITATVVALVVAGIAIAAGLAMFTRLDPVTAYLAASPGALSQMAALATSTGSDSLLVLTVHTARVITVLVISPLIARFLT